MRTLVLVIFMALPFMVSASEIFTSKISLISGTPYTIAYNSDEGYRLDPRYADLLNKVEGHHFNIPYVEIVSEVDIEDFEFNSNILQPTGQTSVNPLPLHIGIFVNNDEAAFLYGQLINRRKSKDQLQKQSSLHETWLFENPTVRFHLKKEGVGFITGSDIIATDERLLGVLDSDLKLVNLGQSKPYYLTGSDKKLDANDTIYFWNDIVHGDSTFKHFYAPHNTYYLTLADHFESKHLVLINKTTQKLANTAFHRIHLEDDDRYSMGANVLDNGTADFEGLFKSEIQFYENRPALIYNKDSYIIHFPGNSGQGKVTMTYAMLDAFQQPEEIVDINVNGETVFTENRDAAGYYEVKLDLNNSTFINGPNSIGIGSNLPVVETLPAFPKFLDYVEIEGEAKPIAINGLAHFRATDDTYYNVPNQSSRIGISIAEETGTIQFHSGNNIGTSLLASAKNEYLALTFGNQQFSSETRGYHLITFEDAYSDIPEFSSVNDIDSLKLIFNSSEARIKIVAANTETIGFNQPFVLPELSPDEKIIMVFTDSELVYSTDPQVEIDIAEEINSTGISSFVYEVASSESGWINTADRSRISKAFGIGRSSDISNEEGSPDYIIITQEKLLQGAQDYANYRRETGFETRIVEVQDIYDLYNNGIKHPIALKNYFNDMYLNWEKPPAYCFLIGDANLDTRMDDFESGEINSFVPTFGLPASDVWYTYLNDDDFICDIMLSRLPATTNEDIRGYLRKMRQHEQAPTASWNKDLLSIYGYDKNYEKPGDSNIYLNIFGSIIGSLNSSDICTDSVMVVNMSIEAVSENLGNKIRNEINEGKLWTTYFGHASAELFEIDGWGVEVLNNNGKYGFFSTISCNTGAFSDPFTKWSRNETYVIDSLNGFIAVSGSSGTGHTGADPVPVSRAMFNFRNHGKRTLGELFINARNFGTDGEDFVYTAVKYNYNILGDPAAKLPVDVAPNYLILGNSFEYRNENGESTIFIDNDSIRCRLQVFNNGIKTIKNVSALVIREWGGESDTIRTTIGRICNSGEFEFSIPVDGKDQENIITVIVDPDKEFDTSDNFEQENVFRSSIYVFARQFLPVEPQEGWSVSDNNPKFRYLLPSFLAGKASDLDYEFKIYDKTGNLIKGSSDNDVWVGNGYVTWEPVVSLDLDTEYKISAKYIDEGLESSALIMGFLTEKIERYDNQQVKRSLTESDYISLKNNWDLDFTFDSTLTRKVDRVKWRIENSIGYPGIWNYLNVYGSINGGEEQFLASEPFIPGMLFLVYNRDSISKLPKRYFFDTFGGIEEEFDIDTLRADRVVWFLRDTLSESDIVIGSVSKNYWRAFYEFEEPGSFSHIDSLSKYFAALGIDMPDSLVKAASWAFMGSKDPLLSSEMISHYEYGDSIEVSGEFYIKEPKGYLRTERIGASQNWKSLNILGERLELIDSVVFNLFDKGVANERIVAENFSTNYDLDNLGLGNNDIELEVYWTNKYHESTIIDDIVFYFDAKPEMLVNTDSTYFISDVLRGDYLEYVSQWENISLRNTESPKVRVIFNGEQRNYEGKSRLLEIFDTIASDFLPNILALELELDNLNPDLYSFNNSANISGIVYEDTIRPYLSAMIDDRVVFNQMFVSSTPKVTIELLDNSKLPIEDFSNFQVRLNGKRLENLDSLFVSKDRFVPLKAILEFELSNDQVYYGNINANYIEAFATDRTGNRTDTLDITFNISKNNKSDSLSVYPNPSPDRSNISFVFRGPDDKQNARITIVDIGGREIATREFNVVNGTNQFTWDGIDDNGLYASAGVYLFRIDIDSRFASEAIYGKLIRTP